MIKYKLCNSEKYGCGKLKPLSEFGNKKDAKDGKYYICKECRKKYDKKLYENKKELRKKQVSEWTKNNRDKRNFADAKRRAFKKGATPENANFEKIATFYKESKMLTEITGIPFHVDHVYPLSKGGLHHESNLRVITLKDNCEKGDRLPNKRELALAGKLRYPELFFEKDELKK
jgi:hypothetical protein